ncbi:hypothetical protein AAES_80018 [Amazona aestiva]|uniref:Uncharacterized protein n=1 Tax=Amazona aestiva TaxID=12930 RepID=A0A0Q3MGE0_AMAAE|nr:hypothetical protein AAES_80018 [Amazona aestiva]
MGTCWGLAYAYSSTLSSTFKRKKIVSGSDGKAIDSAAVPTPSTAATPAPATSTVATQTLTATDSAANPTPSAAATPEDQFVPILVALVSKGKSKKEARKLKQDEETMYSPPGTASDQELLVCESEEEEEEENVPGEKHSSFRGLLFGGVRSIAQVKSSLFPE